MQRALLAAAIFTGTGLLLTGMLWLAQPVPVSVERTTTLRYAFEIRNTAAEPITETELLLFAPADVRGRQRVARLGVNVPHTIERDAFGNNTVRIVHANLPPFGSRVIVIDADVTSFDPPLREEPGELAPFLAPEPKVQASDPRIRKQARALRERSDDAIRGLFEWVAHAVEDVGYVTEDRGALYALLEKRGDCTEFMSLYSALARALEIPTRNVAGFVVSGASGRLSSHAYHNWAEAYDGRRWVLVDPQNEIFDSKYSAYVVFRVLTPETQLSNTQRFFAADPRLQVKML